MFLFLFSAAVPLPKGFAQAGSEVAGFALYCFTNSKSRIL
jgi:hypothetical protein